jgi:hypothetical protein
MKVHKSSTEQKKCSTEQKKCSRINRKLALILRSHHSVGKCLAAPLQVSNVWISSAGGVKLRGVHFTGKHLSIERFQDDYKRQAPV